MFTYLCYYLLGCSEKPKSSEIISNHSDYDVVGHVWPQEKNGIEIAHS